MNRHPFSLCWSKKIDTPSTPQIHTPFPSVARLKIDTPNPTGTNMYKTPHKGKGKGHRGQGYTLWTIKERGD